VSAIAVPVRSFATTSSLLTAALSELLSGELRPDADPGGFPNDRCRGMTNTDTNGRPVRIRRNAVVSVGPHVEETVHCYV